MDQTLRIYANPLKLILYFSGSLGFVVVALLLLHDPKFHANARNTAIAYIAVFFFGLGVVVFLIMLLRDGVLRHPVLQINAHGWTYNPSLGFRSQRVDWPAIGGVAIHRQQVRTSQMYYLVLAAKHPDKLPASRLHSLTAGMYPSVSRAAMMVPLNSLYLRTTPEKAEQLLRDIQGKFANELYGNGIALVDTIQEL